MLHLDPQAEKYLQALNQMPPIHKMEPKTVREMLANGAVEDVLAKKG